MEKREFKTHRGVTKRRKVKYSICIVQRNLIKSYIRITDDELTPLYSQLTELDAKIDEQVMKGAQVNIVN